jgi:hypothetical protein
MVAMNGPAIQSVYRRSTLRSTETRPVEACPRSRRGSFAGFTSWRRESTRMGRTPSGCGLLPLTEYVTSWNTWINGGASLFKKYGCLVDKNIRKWELSHACRDGCRRQNRLQVFLSEGLSVPRRSAPNDNPLTGPSAREALLSWVTCVVTHRRDRRWDCTAGLICTPTITC